MTSHGRRNPQNTLPYYAAYKSAPPAPRHLTDAPSVTCHRCAVLSVIPRHHLHTTSPPARGRPHLGKGRHRCLISRPLPAARASSARHQRVIGRHLWVMSERSITGEPEALTVLPTNLVIIWPVVCISAPPPAEETPHKNQPRGILMVLAYGLNKHERCSFIGAFRHRH